jgi:hypothetical protein
MNFILRLFSMYKMLGHKTTVKKTCKNVSKLPTLFSTYGFYISKITSLMFEWCLGGHSQKFLRPTCDHSLGQAYHVIGDHFTGTRPYLPRGGGVCCKWFYKVDIK